MKKIFISYSHLDADYRTALETHLSTLKRNGHIDSWSDRKIVAGQDWEEEIDSNLDSADMVLFLVSPDLLASEYCSGIELSKALQMHVEGRAAVVPIIIRHCDWKDSRLGRFQALPEDGNPISAWGDRDKGWLGVVEGLKKILKAQGSTAKSHAISVRGIGHLNESFLESLNDTEIELAHRRANKVALDDVFVSPDLRLIDAELDNSTRTIEASALIHRGGWQLIFGDEQSGKTTLAKHYFRELVAAGWNPVLLNGVDIKNSNVHDLVGTAYYGQYATKDYAAYWSSASKALIIDDYSGSKLNRKYQNRFLSEVRREFSLVIIFAIDSFQFVAPEIEELEKFSYSEILPFGNLKRSKLIERWVTIGVEEQISENDLYQNLDTLKLHVDSFVNRNIVPAKPIYLLSILQMLEAILPQNVELTSYGHCYQYLIYRALAKAKIKNTHIDSYINWLTEIADAIFASEGAGLSEKELKDFHDKYSAKYLTAPKTVQQDFENSGILTWREHRIVFKYRYIYYFYAAKRLSEGLTHNTASKEKIRHLLLNLHKEEYANIIIFLTHHTKDPWILDEIQLCVMELFQNFEPAELESNDLEFMKEFLDSIPKLVIEQREIEEERKADGRNKDHAEVFEKEVEERAKDLHPSEMLATINRAFKGIELIGQITRNRHGSLDRARLKHMIGDAFGVGLRFLQCFLKVSQTSQDEVIKVIEHMLRQNPRVDDAQLEKEARSTFLLLTFGVINSVIKKIATSAGSREASVIYAEIEKDTPTPAIKLINLAIELQFEKKLDEKRLRELSEQFRSNITCDRILKQIVVQHIYMHHVKYQDKQRIAQILQLPMSGQRALELNRDLKR